MMLIIFKKSNKNDRDNNNADIFNDIDGTNFTPSNILTFSGGPLC